MSKPFDLRLYLVTDRRLAGARGVVATVEAAIAGGVTIVQVRSPDVFGRSFVEEARVLKALLKPHGIPLIVNDRVDVALAADADGVHVGQSDIDPADVRAMLGPDRIIGLSVHSETEWQASQGSIGAVDYLGVGPAYATSTKQNAASAIGPEGIGKLVGISHLPVVGIGGIGTSNAADVMASGVDGIAVVSAIMAAADPASAARDLLGVVDTALKSRSAKP